MPKLTQIEWTNGSVNPTSGCDGCEILKECYARKVHVNRLAHSFPANYSKSFLEVRTIPGRLRQAANWGPLTEAEIAGKPWFKGKRRHIFISDMSDALSAAVPFQYLLEEIIVNVSGTQGRRHVWQWLTKRPERMAEFDAWLAAQGIAWPANLWAGTSVTTQPRAQWRIPELLKVRAAVRFLSCEPLRGPLDLAYACFNGADSYGTLTGIHWVIAGGESGGGDHPMHPDWVRSLRDQCQAAAVPFFFKQWGDWGPTIDSPMVKLGKKNAGRLLDGHEWNELPEVAA